MKYTKTSAAGLFVIGVVAAIVLSGVGRTDSSGIALVRAIVGVGLLVLFASTANGLSQTGAPLRDISAGIYEIKSIAEQYSDGRGDVLIVCRQIFDDENGFGGSVVCDDFFYRFDRAAFEGKVENSNRLRVVRAGTFKRLQLFSFEEHSQEVVSHGTQR